MNAGYRNGGFRAGIYILALCIPLLLLAQTSKTETEKLHEKIDELSEIINQLKAERSLSGDIDNILSDDTRDFTKRDSLRLVSLRQRQNESRARIDALTLDVIRLSKQLEDPKKRYALARKLKESKTIELSPPGQANKLDTVAIDTISAQAIDLAAVALVRQGKSLDQARLLVIDHLTPEQVRNYYRGLPREARYQLYDLADNLIQKEGRDLTTARKTAIYFYLYAK